MASGCVEDVCQTGYFKVPYSPGALGNRANHSARRRNSLWVLAHLQALPFWFLQDGFRRDLWLFRGRSYDGFPCLPLPLHLSQALPFLDFVPGLVVFALRLAWPLVHPFLALSPSSHVSCQALSTFLPALLGACF